MDEFVMHWKLIGKYSLGLLLAQMGLGFIEGLLTFTEPSSQAAQGYFPAGTGATFLVSIVLFWALSARHVQRRLSQATLVFLVYLALWSVASFLISAWLGSSPPLLFLLELLVVSLGALVGTFLGAVFPRARSTSPVVTHRSSRQDA